MNRTVYIVTGDCGDYYCDSDHVLAVAATEPEAQELAAAARELPRFRDTKWQEVFVTGPFEVGALNALSFDKGGT